MSATLDALIDELHSEINRAGGQTRWPDPHFLGLAERLCQAQVAGGAAVHRAPPHPLRMLEDIPPVTSDAFRFADVRAGNSGRPAVLAFRSSGTTDRYRSSHLLYRSDIYDASALVAFETLVGATHRPTAMISLVARHDQQPDSSLAYMVELFARERFAGATHWVLGSAGLDAEALSGALVTVSARGAPALLFATTLAAAALLESNVEGDLPSGSLILTTGGAKGRRDSLDGADVEAALAARFGDTSIGAEYGMTELLSQAYRIGDEPLRLPPWCRVLAIDPASGARQPHGHDGLLRFIDLANAQSAIALQTGDWGATHDDQSFTLHGRAPGARLRGCSLTYEEMALGEASR